MSYIKIVQVGASGNVGAPVKALNLRFNSKIPIWVPMLRALAPVLQALITAGKFEITVVARHNSNFTAPNPSVKVVKVDFSNKQELVNAFKGNDAIAITMGDLANLEKNSKDIIDAAIEAGVKRILPSEFGNDLANSPGRDEIAFTTKIKVAQYLEEKSEAGEIEYTVISVGPFFDWGLTHQFLGFDIPNRKAVLYSGGNGRFNTTTLETVGASVAAVLANPAPYKNKSIQVSDFYVTQKEILAVLEAETGSKFTVEDVDVNKLQEDSHRGLLNGEWTEDNIYGAIKASIYGPVSSASWGQEDDSQGLGLPKKDFKEEIKKVL